MSEIPKISEAEWQILKIIWNKPKITSTEIIKELENKEAWKSSTIKSLINRLLNKNAIAFEKLGKEYLYYAVVEESECIIKESKSFLNRVFDGSINSMLINFVKSEKLSQTEIEELKSTLNDEENKGEK